MTDKQKIERLETLGWDMYHAAQNLTTDASSLHKAMNKWWQFVNHELNEEEPVSESLEEAAREAATWHSRINGNQFFPNDYNKFIAGAEWADEHPDIEAIKAIEDHAYFAGSEAMREKMTNKACEWLKDNWRKHVWLDGDNIIHFGLWENDFRTSMEE